jgi:hypothetical protein
MSRGEEILEAVSPALDAIYEITTLEGDDRVHFQERADKFLEVFVGVLESRAVCWPLPVALIELEHAIVWQGLDPGDEREALENRYTAGRNGAAIHGGGAGGGGEAELRALELAAIARNAGC